MNLRLRIPTKYYGKEKIFTRANFELHSGLTVLVGCNGIGKSTVLHFLNQQLNSDNIIFKFNNLVDGGSHAKEKHMLNDDIDFVVRSYISSEGEEIMLNFEDLTQRMGKTVREAKVSNQDRVFFLFDALDSGLSIDHIVEMKKLFGFVISDCLSNGISPYIVVAANSYEMAKGSDCLKLPSLTYGNFTDYDTYRKYIIKTRDQKNERYGWELFKE